MSVKPDDINKLMFSSSSASGKSEFQLYLYFLNYFQLSIPCNRRTNSSSYPYTLDNFIRNGGAAKLLYTVL